LEEKLLVDDNLHRQFREESKGEIESILRSENNLSEANIVKKDFQPKYTLRSHMDVVRGLMFVPDIDSLASVSEDCTLKIWSLKGLDKVY